GGSPRLRTAPRQAPCSWIHCPLRTVDMSTICRIWLRRQPLPPQATARGTGGEMMSETELGTGSAELPPAGEWEIDPAHSDVTFTARYMMLSKVRGRFGIYSGTIHVG